MKKTAIRQLFDSFSGMNILVIGDVMVDAYLWGKVERISPEAPVPVVSVNRRENRLGGAANVALNLASMGATPFICSVIGKDERAALFYELLKKADLPHQGILSFTERKTTMKTRVLSQSQHMLRVDDETDREISGKIESGLIAAIRKIINNEKVDAVVFEDYDKGVITPEVIRETIALAAEMKIPVAVDPKRRNFLAYRGATLFKPNFREMNEGLKISVSKENHEEMMAAAKMLYKKLHAKYIMITLSDAGIFISDGKKCQIVPSEVRDISDVSGAGDTVISVAALCLAAGLKLHDIAAISNLAGGLVCEKMGVVPVDREQLLSECILKL